MSEQVNLRTIYDIVSSLEDKMDRRFNKVEEKIDNVAKEARRSMEEMDERVSGLEGFKMKITGALMILGIFVGGLASFIWEKVTQ